MIGVFDSGLGGLTILEQLLTALPQYSYIYLADTANTPYGSRSAEEIYELTAAGVRELFAEGAEVVILGCNTASACALRRLQQEGQFEKTVLGIVVPTVEQITGVPWRNVEPAITPLGTITVGVIATERTVASGAYVEEIHKRNPSLRVIQKACPALVPAVERGVAGQELASLITPCVENLVGQVDPSDPPLAAVLLGCTHYALIAKEIAAALPPHVRLYEQPRIVGRSLAAYLARHPEIESRLDRQSLRHYRTTGDPEIVSRHSARYLGRHVTFTALNE